jgi:hypothetical protein
MRMGNYLCAGSVLSNVMSAKRPRLGVNHPTVVPTNFEPNEESARPETEPEPDTER